ncbi:MAG: hypothetical protein ACLQHL_03845, partial [Candidatus Cybelea sp.]
RTVTGTVSTQKPRRALRSGTPPWVRFIGGLIGVRIGESRAKQYEKGLREGGIVVAVRPKSKEHRAEVRRALDRDVEYAGETRSQ